MHPPKWRTHLTVMKIRITLWINLFKQLQRISTQGRQFLMESKQSYYWRLARVIEKAAPFLIFWTKQVLRLYILILLLKKAKTKTGNKSEQSTLSLSVHNFTRYAVEWGKIFKHLVFPRPWSQFSKLNQQSLSLVVLKGSSSHWN